jgi:DNA-directed RNA polymerase subunit RPC12/RpoP
MASRAALLSNYFSLSRPVAAPAPAPAPAPAVAPPTVPAKKRRKKKPINPGRPRRSELVVAMQNQTLTTYECARCHGDVILKAFGPVLCESCGSHVVLKARSQKSTQVRAI